MILEYVLTRKKVSILILLHLSAAFDNIDHSILLDRLKYDFGFDGIVLKWFTAYLTNRTQSVSVNKSFSSKQLLSFGVPQDSVLGPFFIHYIPPLWVPSLIVSTSNTICTPTILKFTCPSSP